MGILNAVFGVEQAIRTPQGYEIVTDTAPLFKQINELTPAQLYRTQPHLRTVVSFIARNVAKLGLHLYERDADGGRTRVRDSEGVTIFKRADNLRTDYGLMYSLVATLALHDVAYWWITDTNEGKKIIEILPDWVVKERGKLFDRPDIDVIFPGMTEPKRIKAGELIRFAGWSPDSYRGVSSPVDALREMLREQIEAVAYRQQVWARGGRVSSVIVRPAGITWSNEARKRFQEDWRKNWTGAGAKAGGTPILEDGMELKQSGFSPRESEWVEVAKLSQATVAAIYHVNPTLIGILDNANYSNVREFRKSLYGDNLGPLLKQIQSHLNQQLLPIVGLDPTRFFYEFNIAEQLQSTPEEQAQVFSSSVGAPWLTRNEVRAMQNMPRIEGGDELIVPLNVLEGGLASPRDTDPFKNTVPQIKAASSISFKSSDFAQDDDAKTVTEILTDHAERVMRSVKAKTGTKEAREWWDEQRWNDELKADLLPFIIGTANRLGRDAMIELEHAATEYDAKRTEAYLSKFAEHRSAGINAGILALVEIARRAVTDGDPIGESFDHALMVFKNARAQGAARALTTSLASFSILEAARQSGERKVTKTWHVMSQNPRPTHKRMNGVTVGRDETFPNGMKYPGDYDADADETVNCHCELEITLERGSR